MGSAQQQSELWGQEARNWVKLTEPNHAPLFRAMLDAANVNTGTRLLDIGCGGGTSSKLAVERGAQVSGLDATPELIDLARQQAASADFRVGDMENLPYEDHSFDTVMAANSLQYAADRIAALQEFKRVCKSDGTLVIGLFGPPEQVALTAMFSAIRDAMPEPPPGAGPFELSMPGVLEDLVTQAGFQIEASAQVDCPMIYADLDSYWQGCLSGGPIQGARRILGDEQLKIVMRDAVADFRQDDGRYVIGPNYFKYLVAGPQ